MLTLSAGGGHRVQEAAGGRARGSYPESAEVTKEESRWTSDTIIVVTNQSQLDILTKRIQRHLLKIDTIKMQEMHVMSILSMHIKLWNIVKREQIDIDFMWALTPVLPSFLYPLTPSR